MPKKEYIECEAVLEELNKVPAYFDSDDVRWGIEIAMSVVKKQPAADVVEVKHGEWIEGRTLEKCSLCGKKGFPDWRYCPNCGADMRGNKNGK